MFAASYFFGSALVRRIISLERRITVEDSGAIHNHSASAWSEGPHLWKRLKELNARITAEDMGTTYSTGSWKLNLRSQLQALETRMTAIET